MRSFTVNRRNELLVLLVAVGLLVVLAVVSSPPNLTQVELPDHLSVGVVVAIALLLVNFGLLLTIVTYGMLTGAPQNNQCKLE